MDSQDGDTHHVSLSICCVLDVHKCCTYVIRDQNDDYTETSNRCSSRAGQRWFTCSRESLAISAYLSWAVGKDYRTQIMHSSESLPGVSPSLAQGLSGPAVLSRVVGLFRV